MRRGEILGLTWERVDRSRGVILLERTKGGRRREVPMRTVVDQLFAGKPAASRRGRVWPVRWPRDAWDAAVTEAGIEDFTFHDCRHHFASWFVMRGGSPRALKEILGHKTMAMTMRYAHPSDDHLRAEIAKTERSEPGQHMVSTKLVESPADAT